MDFFFFFNDTATTEIYTLSLHDALPIFGQPENGRRLVYLDNAATTQKPQAVLDAVAEYYRTTNANVHRGAYDLAIRATEDRKSTRLNSSHSQISYAVFCLKKKKFMPQKMLTAMYQRFGGAKRAAKKRSDVLVGMLVLVAETNRHALAGW